MSEECIATPQSPTPTFVGSFSRSSTGTSLGAWQSTPPFEEKDQICKDLEYAHQLEKPPRLRSRRRDQVLPDAPRIALDSCRLVSYCLEDLDTPGMNKLGEKLWWAGPNPDVKSLTRQLTFERTIVVTEDPSLHLLWADSNLYIKPLPAYITSYAFWEYLVDPSNDSINPEERERLRTTALGFLRTYAALIQRRSDFTLARRKDLLGAFGNTSFEAFIKFIKDFDCVPDKAISPRWRYGEIQLDALNLHSTLHLHKWHLNRFESNYGPYFQRYFPVILFLYALFSVMLSAMQVILAARQLWDTDNHGVKRTLGLFTWFSCEAIGWSMSFGIIFLAWWLCIVSAEGWKRMKTMKRVKKKQKDEQALEP